MVNPSGQTTAAVRRRRAATTADRPSRADGSETRARILDAAYRRLGREGYARLSLREIAADLGINHGLINYHFRTKDNLVLAVLDEANERLLARQQRMYEAEVTVREKWDQACRFYEDDLRSGFVRLMIELMAASLSNTSLRDELRPRFLAWRRVVDAAVRDALVAYRIDLPVSADAIGAWIGAFWTGMEVEMMLGIGERDGHHRAALDAMRTLLVGLEGRASSTAREATPAAKTTLGKSPKKTTGNTNRRSTR